MGRLAQFQIGLGLGREAIALDAPVLAAIIADQDQPIMPYRPAALASTKCTPVSIWVVGTLACCQLCAIIIGIQDMAALACNHQACTGFCNIQQQRLWRQRHCWRRA